MTHPNRNGTSENGKGPSRSAARTNVAPMLERPGANYTALRNTVLADHEMEVHLESFRGMLEQDHPDMAAFLKSHSQEIRSVMTAALDAAILAERRRLTWLLHNDLYELLAAARSRLAVVVDANAGTTTGDALLGVDVCLAVAAKAARGMISDLDPPSSFTNRKE